MEPNRINSGHARSRSLGRKALAVFSTVSLTAGLSFQLVPVEIAGISPAVAHAQTNPTLSNEPVAVIDGNHWTTSLIVQDPGEISSVRLTATEPGTFPSTGTYQLKVRAGNNILQEAGSATGLSQDGRTVEIVFHTPIKLKNGQALLIQYYGNDHKSLPLKKLGVQLNTKKSQAPAPKINQLPLELGANPGRRDPLKENDDPDACIIDVTQRDVSTSTWIVESYFDSPDGTKPRNIYRNRSVLQYRVDGAQGAEAFKPVNGNGVSDWVYNALAYNPADGFLYGISLDRPLGGAASGLTNTNPDPQHPAGHLLRISPVTGEVAPIGPIDGLDDIEVRSGFTNGTFDLNGDFVFANNSANGTGDIYRISFSGGSSSEFSVPENDGEKILTSRSALNDIRPTSANDWAYAGFEKSPYAWSINSEGGHRYLYRFNTETGEVIEGVRKFVCEALIEREFHR